MKNIDLYKNLNKVSSPLVVAKESTERLIDNLTKERAILHAYRAEEVVGSAAYRSYTGKMSNYTRCINKLRKDWRALNAIHK